MVSYVVLIAYITIVGVCVCVCVRELNMCNNAYCFFFSDLDVCSCLIIVLPPCQFILACSRCLW